VLRRAGTARGLRLSSSRVVATVHDRLISHGQAGREERPASLSQMAVRLGVGKTIFNRRILQIGEISGGECLTCIRCMEDFGSS
jgi:hypothetical protein